MAIHESVSCPHCQKSFALSEAIFKDFEASLRLETEKEFRAKEDLLKKKMQDSEKGLADLAQKAEAEKLELKRKAEAEKAELQKRLESEKQAVARKAEQEKQELRKQVEADALKRAEEKYSLECKDLKNAVEEQNQRLRESQENELKLRARQRELEQKEKQFEIEMQRKLLEHENTVAENIRKEIDDEISLKMAAKDKVVEDMKKEMQALQRKLDQGSQQLQGEVLELKIEELIRERFPEDEVVEVKKGARGADIEHRVMMASGRLAGVIFSECKDVKEWSPQWPTKLKNDLRAKGGDVGLICSTVLPKDIRTMGIVDGVWVCSPSVYATVVALLRDRLIHVKRAELAATTPVENKDFLFQYMTSQRFSQRVQAIVEKVNSMKSTLETEKRSFAKIWKKREIEIEGISNNMFEMYGELEGLIGKALPKVEALELPSAEDSEEIGSP
jgi:hypothetical protein